MAKTKKEKKPISQIEAEIVERFGDGIFVQASDVISNPKKIIPICPSLSMIGCDVPEGSWVISSGKPKCGKTQTALKFAAECQKVGKKVFYLNIEGRLKKMNLEGTKGLDPEEVQMIRSTKGKILTAENWLNIAEAIIKNEPGCLLIFDSSSALCAESEMTADSNGQMRPAGPKLLGQFCRKMANVVPVNDTIVWFIQHLYTNTSGKGAGFLEDGGVKIDYQRDIKIRCQYVEQWKIGSEETGRQIGQKIHWSMLSSALGGIPNATCTSFLRYGTGIDDLQEYIEIAGSLGLWLKRAGSWYSFEGSEGTEVKVQGAEKLYEHFNSHPEDFDLLKNHFKSVFGAK